MASLYDRLVPADVPAGDKREALFHLLDFGCGDFLGDRTSVKNAGSPRSAPDAASSRLSTCSERTVRTDATDEKQFN